MKFQPLKAVRNAVPMHTHQKYIPLLRTISWTTMTWENICLVIVIVTQVIIIISTQYQYKELQVQDEVQTWENKKQGRAAGNVRSQQPWQSSPNSTAQGKGRQDLSLKCSAWKGFINFKSKKKFGLKKNWVSE